MTIHRRRISALTVSALLCWGLLAGCSTDESLRVGSTGTESDTSAPSGEADATYPVTVSSCGRDYTYDQAPSRVVLGYPRSLETMEALGVADSAYGYAHGDYDDLPADYPGDVIEVSPDYQPSRESVIGAQPDLFLGNDEGQLVSDGGASLADLRRAGSDAYFLGGYCSNAPAPTSLDVVLDDLENLGRIFGVEERAAEVVTQAQDRIAAAAELGRGQDLSIGYVQVFDGKLYAISGYPASGVIEALGMTNEFADIKANFAEISKEEALTRDPDVLLVLYVGADNETQAVADVEELLASTPAVEYGRVFGADDTDFYAGGLTIIDALERVAEQAFQEDPR